MNGPDLHEHHGQFVDPIEGLPSLAKSIDLYGWLRTTKRLARNTSQEAFLALWRNADPDVPILKEAKAEYARLQ